MAKRFSYVIALGVALLMAVGCVTTKRTTTVRHVHVKTNPAVTQVKVHQPGGGPDKIQIKTNPSGTHLKVHAKK